MLHSRILGSLVYIGLISNVAFAGIVVQPQSITIDVKQKTNTGQFIEVVNKDKKNQAPVKIEILTSRLNPSTGAEDLSPYAGTDVKVSRHALLLQPGESRRIGIIYDKTMTSTLKTQKAFRIRTTQVALSEISALLPQDEKALPVQEKKRRAGIEIQISYVGWILLNPGQVEARIAAKTGSDKEGRFIELQNDGTASGIVSETQLFSFENKGTSASVKISDCKNLKPPFRLHVAQVVRCRLGSDIWKKIPENQIFSVN